MAGRPQIPDRKRRTREHIIADLSVNHVEKQALLCGFSIERVRHDYGIDLFLFSYNKQGEVENEWIPLQLKATDRLRRVDQGKFIAYRLERADLHAWLRELFPVILVVYDAPADRGYWLYLQAYFEKLPRFNLKRAAQSVVVRIPATNVLDPDAIRTFVGFRDRILAHLKTGVTHAE